MLAGGSREGEKRKDGVVAMLVRVGFIGEKSSEGAWDIIVESRQIKLGR